MNTENSEPVVAPAPNSLSASAELLCPICRREKVTHQWVCHNCFRRLPGNFRKAFSTLKLQALWWVAGAPGTTRHNHQMNPYEEEELLERIEAEYIRPPDCYPEEEWSQEDQHRLERIEAEYLTPADCGLSDAEEQAFDKE